MPDKVVTTPGSGKIEFVNDQGVEKASLELIESDDTSSGDDEVKIDGMKIDGGTF